MNEEKSRNELILYTESAARLMVGRKANRIINQYPIYGLFQFASMMNVIWRDAKNRNPFAFWYLVKVEKKISMTQQSIDQHSRFFSDQSNDGTGLVYEPFLHEPKSFDVVFSVPHTWTAARQIKQFDSVVLHGKKLNSVGLIPNNTYHSILREISRLIVASFNEAAGYVSLEIQADDIESKSDVAKQGYSAMGGVPGKILSGDLRPDFTPE